MSSQRNRFHLQDHNEPYEPYNDPNIPYPHLVPYHIPPPNRDIKCHCNLIPVRRQSQKDNPRKYELFYACLKFRTVAHDNKCNYFRWERPDYVPPEFQQQQPGETSVQENDAGGEYSGVKNHDTEHVQNNEWVTNEFVKLHEEIDSLKQTIEYQNEQIVILKSENEHLIDEKKSFNKELEDFNAEIRILKRKLENEREENENHIKRVKMELFNANLKLKVIKKLKSKEK